MNGIRIQTASRLHFGLLAWKSGLLREFGGIGLMIAAPGIALEARLAPAWQAEGPLAKRALQFAERMAARLAQEGALALPPARIRILRAAPEHVGLGTGTQLGLAVARALLALGGQPEPPIDMLASLAERGLRSGIGLHGFVHGGLLVDGGKPVAGESGVPPLLCRLEFPAEWGVLVVVPDAQAGLHGLSEVQAFAQLPPFPEALTDRLCRLVLLGILPAVADRALDDFGASLDELQQLVGQCFAPAQGGAPLRPELEGIAQFLRSQGLRGVGQSSWGPALYGFSADEPVRRAEILERLRRKFHLGAEDAFWTEARNCGSTVLMEG